MTYRVRKVNDAVLAALTKAHNDERRAQIGAEVHYDISGDDTSGDVRDPTQNDLQITAAGSNGTLPVLLVLVNDIRTIYNQHINDAHVHDQVDATNVLTEPVATTLVEAQDLCTELKAIYNAHRSQASVHPNNDGGNAITAADGTDQATSDTLCDELKTDVNAHINAALVGQGVQLIAP